MDRAMIRGRAAMIVAMVCGACAGPPQSERAREAPSVQPRPAQNSSITGRAEQRLPRVDTTRVPTRALVLGRHDVQLAQHSEVEHVERLFDGDVSTAPTMAVGATVRLRVGAGVISSLRVFGAIDGWVELRSLQRGQWQRVEIDLRAIPRAADRWRTIAIPTAATSSEIELKFSDTAVASAPSEIEAWGRVEEQPPSRWLAERLVNSTAGFERIAGRGNARRVSTLDLDREPDAGRFVLSRTADALPCRRAFLRYSLDGAAHWTHVTKALNGASLGPASASRPGFGGIQIEEVPASLVRAGDNELRFGVVRPLDPAGYLASDVELLCATSGLASIADVERPASALIDGDATSSVTGTTATASRSLTWDFGGRAQAHTVSFRLDVPSEGALELTADGARTVQRIPLSGRQIGWHDFELPDAWPASGAVTVRVALPSEGLGSISEVRIGASPVASEDHARLVITWPHAGECVDGRMHVRGFVTGAAATANWTVSAGTRTSALDANSGFSLTDVAVSVDSADEIEIRATDGNQRLSRWIPVSRCESTAPRSVAGAQDEGAPLSVWAEPSRDAVLAGGGLRVEIPRGAVSSSTRVTARPLAAASVREMDSGMANVTAGRGAWRLGPSPMRFLHHVKISLPFDRAALPAGKTERDVQLFYFDEASRRWNAVSSEAHDGVVTARTDHFTDWVAATVTNPDSPESSASDGQSVGALGAGHPLAGVHGASAPAVNAQGTATTSFPIVVPPGRHGMQPSISLSYDSSSGGSIVGHGWSLGLPSIAIDTRFGVPTHNGGETYLLNGAALVWVERLSSAGGETRDRFEPRVLTSGLRVVRVQTGAVVTWEVTDPSGTVSYFGTDASARLSAPAGASAPSLPASTEPSDRLYTTSTERTGVWHLSKVIDNFGNTIQYNYQKETGDLDRAAPSEPAEPWVAIAPSTIVYTGHVSGVPAAHFEVHFESDTTRADVAVSARFGFVARSARRITAINVSAGGALVRRYQLDYRVGDFGKTLLQRVIVRGSDGISELFRNEFDYHTAQRDSGNNLGFVRAQQWSSTAAPYALEAGYGKGGGVNVFAGVGDPAFFVNIGAGVGVDGSSADNDVASTDVNGDGLIDFINRQGNVRYNSFAATGGVIDRTAGVLINQTLPLQIPTPFLWEEAVSLGGRVGVSLFTGRGALGATVGGTWNSNTSMFLDVDGDGRPDIVNGTTQEEGHPVLSVRLNPVQMARGSFGVPQPGGAIDRDFRIGGLQLVPTERSIDLPPDLAGGQQFYRTAPLVRWTSQIQGKVRLSGVIERVGSGGDGVELQVFVARGMTRAPAGAPEWSTTLGAGTCTPSGSNGCDGSAPPEFSVSAGDRIYFLVKPKNNIDGDTVFWNPRLEVVESYGCPSQIQGDLVFCVPNAPPGTYFDRAADFRLADRDIVGFTASSAGTVEINATFASSTPVVAKLYRRRRVSATPPPVVTASGLTAAELTALFSATLEPTVTEVHSWPAMAGGTLFLNGVPVDERDELIVHFLLPIGTDPATISNFTGNVRYVSLIEAGLSYTIGACAPPAGLPAEAPPVPAAAWACALSATTASGRTSIPQALVVSTIDSPAVAWLRPSRALVSESTRSDSMFGFYRGWSYAEWNSEVAFSDEGVANPFQQTYTELIEAVTASPRRPVLPPRMLPMLPKPAGSRFVLGADDGVHGTVLADLSAPLWRGSGIDSFVTATTLKPSSRSVFFVDATGRVLRTTSVGASATDAPGLRAGYSMSTGVNISASVGPVGGSASSTSLRSNNDLDFFDFNGDGLPDSVRWTAAGGTVQIQLPRTASNPDGAFSPPIPVHFPNMRPGLRQSNTSLDVGGFGFATAGQTWTARSGGNGVQFSAGNGQAGLGQFDGMGIGSVDMLDVNGDGLPDSVRTTEESGAVVYDVAYNLGYGFSRRVRLSGGGSFDEPVDERGASLVGTFVRQNCGTNVQAGFRPIGAGLSLGRSRLRVSSIDLNGDGLVDRVWRNRGETGPTGPFWHVQFNLGDRWSAAEKWVLPAWVPGAEFPTIAPPPCLSDLAASDDDRNMLSLTNTYSIPVSLGVPLSIWTPIVGIHVDIGAHYEHRWNETNLTIGDIDGDGNVDQILRANNRIFARVNDNGKANLLRTITGPTGGVITIGYAREGNHITAEGSTVRREMPTNQWVMASVTATGPHASSYTTTFDYASSGNYDRVEREFYGFGTVIARRSDGARSETYFHNQDYYRRGTAYEQRAFSSTGMVLGRSVSEWSAPTPGLAPRSGTFFPSRTSETSYLYNGATTNLAEFVAQSTTTYEYDSNHRLREIFDPREAGASDDRRTQIDYYVNTARWIIAVREVRLLDSSNNVVQRQTKDFDSFGQVRWIENLLVGGVDPATGTPWDGSAGRNPKVSFKYDSFGNVSTVTDPTGYQRSLTYDPVTRSRPVSITDSFGYSTHTAWNYGFGAPTISTDSNGVQREVRYDQFGRVKEVYGAYEFGTVTPTSSYSYALGSGGPLPTALWAQSSTIDPSHPGETIDAIVFVDGLGRTLQSKREITVELASGTVETGFSVSGLTEYDSLGRASAVHQPSYAGPGVPLTTLSPMPPSNPETVTYDIFGRLKTHVQPNGDTTSIAYGFAPIAGVLRSYVAVTDAKLRTRTAYSDLSGNVVLNRQSVTVAGTPTTVETQYFYDLLDRLVRVRDAADNDTIATYDSRGLMTSLTNADTGLVEYQYTLAGDLGARITPTLRSNGQRISYTREWHRLSKIEYPGGGNVTFSYGAAGAPFHSAGRVTTLSDRSGTQSFQYGRNGEVLWNSRTLVAFGTLADPTTTAMTFNYDSLGRTQSITYPDGEKVEYEYDHGGNLRHVASADRTYVDEIRYDHYGRRRRVRNGNGTESVFTYDAVMQRLSQLDTTTSLGATALQSLRYQYDGVGLIDRIENAIPTGAMRGYSLRKFQYDENDQLTHATGELEDASGDSRRFSLDMAYDAIGRITQMNQLDQVFPSGGGAPVTVSATSRNNAYVYGSSRVHAATQVGSDQYWYDPNGNQYYKQNSVSGDWRYLAWDEEDRLSYAFRPSSTAGFQYDAGGARTHKTDYSATTLYPSAYVTIRNGTEVTKHIWAGGQRVGSVVRPEPSKPTEHAYWVHNDHLGGGHYVTTKVGAVYEQAERLPFGESWVEQRAGTDRVSSAFAGSAHDEESGLNYHGARYYDAREARWTGRDPAIEENMAGGGVLDPRNLGLYTYAFNSPVSYWDPDGRQAVGPTPSGNSSQSGIAGSLCDAGATAPGCDGGHAIIEARNTSGTAPAQQGESDASRAVRTGINGWRFLAGGWMQDVANHVLPRPAAAAFQHTVGNLIEMGTGLPRAVYTAATGRNVETGRPASDLERGLATAEVVGTVAGVGAEIPAVRGAIRGATVLRAATAEEGAAGRLGPVLRMTGEGSGSAGGGLAAIDALAETTADTRMARDLATDARILRNLAERWRATPPSNLDEFFDIGNRALQETLGRSGARVFPSQGPPGASMAWWGNRTFIGVAVIGGVPFVFRSVNGVFTVLGRLL